MKKVLVILLVLCTLCFSVFANGTKEAAPAASTNDSPLVAAAKAEGELVVYGSCEEEYLAAACAKFQEMYGIKTTYQRLSTGEVQAKIEEEKGNPSADVWLIALLNALCH